ncbi:hypothetical protein ACJRO0_14040, partial [Acetobacter oryzifermentans]
RGAPMTYLSHNASFHSRENITPSNPGTKYLDLREDQRAGHGMSAEQTQSPESWFDRASQKLSASEGTAPQSNGPKSRDPQIG